MCRLIYEEKRLTLLFVFNFGTPRLISADFSICLHAAKCTAVDIEELDIPSVKGLRKRIGLVSCGSTE